MKQSSLELSHINKRNGETEVAVPIGSDTGRVEQGQELSRWRFARGAAGRFSSQVAVGLGLILLWQLCITLDLINPLVAKSPREVAAFLLEITENGVLWENFRVTVSATLIALVLASVAGVVIGISLGLMPRVEAAVDPYITFLNSMPRIALAPVFIIYFGIGQSAKIALAFSLVVFIVLINARAGIRSADPDIVTLSKVLNINKRQLFTKILLPSAIPSIFAGLRLGVTYAFLGVVASELIAARAGLGQLVAEYSGTFRLEGVFAVLIVLAAVASIINALMAMIEKRLLRWQA